MFGIDSLQRALEIWEFDLDYYRILGAFVRSIMEDTLEPSNWQGSGPVPTGDDGLMQTRVVAAIVESARTGREIKL